MPTPRKVFRIEETLQMAAELQDDESVPDSPSVPAEAIAELRAIRMLMQRRPDGGAAAGDPKNDAQSSETRQLKIELDVIGDAVKQTRCEIAAMQDQGFHASQIARVAKELEAAFHDTTAAADRILNAAEDIDQKALALAACLNDGRHGHGVAKDIQDRVTAIYEACNFHDLTGQRFAKVAQTLKAIEDHLARIVEIWSVIDRFHVDAVPSAAGRLDSLLSGPKLNGDSGHSTQDEIDTLFPVGASGLTG